MIAIKKVQVVPLDENYGKIIDSFSTTDDKTKNAPSINSVENYVGGLLDEKQAIILSGTSDPGSSLGNDGDIYFQYSE